MAGFIKVIRTTDKVIDCIPIVSTLNNIGILFYQLVHKVNKVANPVNTSWTDDVKIHALSKSAFVAGIALIPVIGNLTCLIQHVKEAIGDKGLFSPRLQIGYLKEASRRHYYGTKKHGYEIAALYLARYPDRPEKKQAGSLNFAAYAENKEVFRLILDSREWSTPTLKGLLRGYSSSKSTAELVLDKYGDQLTNADIGEVLSHRCAYYKECDYSTVKFLISKYPQIGIDHVSKALVKLAKRENSLKPIQLLLKKFPDVEEGQRQKALLQASKKKNKEIIELIELHTPGILEKNLDPVLKIAAQNHDISILNWLFELYKEKITPEQIGIVLGEQVQCVYFGENDNSLLIINKLLSTYPDLPPKVLVPVMKKAAIYNPGLFKDYFRIFPHLEPQHLQDIFNEAVFLERKDVAELIKNKFPQMQAVDPYI